MAKATVLTAEQVGELLAYDPETGSFTWRVGRKGTKAGAVAGVISNCLGYRLIGVLCQRHYAHRLAWLLTHGEWPQHQIDHINGDRADNRIINLRCATHLENQQNRHAPKANKHGHAGVFFHPPTGKYVAKIKVMRKRHHLGSFDTPAEAGAAYQAARNASPYQGS